MRHFKKKHQDYSHFGQKVAKARIGPQNNFDFEQQFIASI